MLDDALKLPDDPSILKNLVASQPLELKFRDTLIEKSQHQVAGLRRDRFGAPSEILDQLELTLEEEEIGRAGERRHDEGAAAPVLAKRQPKRRPLPGLPPSITRD